ncbi:MAG: UPF0182 family protein [Deltaproteobacteria bacterium]|nr:UPF0182 family protein [Deltaproteobacteria bacterium]
MTKRIWIGLGILIFLAIWALISVYPNWLWFQALNFSPVFWTMVWSRFGLAAFIWIFLMSVLLINLFIARRYSPAAESQTAFTHGTPISNKTLNTLFLALILIASLVIASKGSAQWNMVLSYIHQQPFGSMDPIFNKDIGFYVFSLPFYTFIKDGLLFIFIFTGLFIIIWYLKGGGLQIISEFIQAQEGKSMSLPRFNITAGAKKHLLILGGIIVILISFGYYLKIYGILYSQQGPAFGASYTDVHIKVFSYWILILLSLAWAVILFLNARKANTRSIMLSGGIWLGAIVLFAYILPVLIQQIVVRPNELAKEAPYINHNIQHTRDAYNLNAIQETDFQANDQLTAEEIGKNDLTIKNIRIWDEPPLLQTYKQIQSIRLYYDFSNVDVDRYTIENQYRQVMLAARELVASQLPPQANTWVNRHLTYTHGYGLALSPVNDITSEGLPLLWVKDLPPAIDIDMTIERPEIYYGEKTDDYILTKTKAEEFDYPKGDNNVYTQYHGKGGVLIGSFIRRLMFSIEFLDPQILFTTYLTPESRIMYTRRIDRRVNTIAPFLSYDSDPYLVVSEGRLFWIMDAYTTSNMYPYSIRSKHPKNNQMLNYIRNSVKVIIDAYNGDVSYYIVEANDPIIQTYAKIFPGLFKPFDRMSEDLKKHVRYPRDLFNIQVGAYTKYHMEDAQVFYNQEDLWQVPNELYGDNRQVMKPYYVIIKLPESEKEEFLLMLPFTPSNKDNMIGWLAARCDMPDYGELFVYKLPKDKLVYGPMQIEARVDQQTEISREFSLWSQRGSRVIRGNLLAIPVGESFIYVEPIYLEAKQEEKTPAQKTPQPAPSLFKRVQKPPASSTTQDTRTSALPELKRVIVGLGNRIVMEEDLYKALNGVLEGERTITRTSPAPVASMGGLPDLGALALRHYNSAKAYLSQGDWAGYGRELAKLEEVLRQMVQEVEGKE